MAENLSRGRRESGVALEVRDPSSLAFVTQTTLSVDDTARVIDALREKFPAIQGPRKDDICYATQNRQDAVKALASEVDLVLVVGSTNSSNSNRLRELAERCGASAFLIDDASMIDPQWLSGKQRIGVTRVLLRQSYWCRRSSTRCRAAVACR